MKLMWLGYLVYSLGDCVMKLCIETDLRCGWLAISWTGQLETETTKMLLGA